MCDGVLLPVSGRTRDSEKITLGQQLPSTGKLCLLDAALPVPPFCLVARARKVVFTESVSFITRNVENKFEITVFVREFPVDTCKMPIDTCNGGGGVPTEKKQPAILHSDWSIACD